MAAASEYCYACGRPLSLRRAWKLFVNYNNCTGRVILPDDTPAGDDWGFLPVGSECARKLPKEYIIRTQNGCPS